MCLSYWRRFVLHTHRWHISRGCSPRRDFFKRCFLFCSECMFVFYKQKYVTFISFDFRDILLPIFVTHFCYPFSWHIFSFLNPPTLSHIFILIGFNLIIIFILKTWHSVTHFYYLFLLHISWLIVEHAFYYSFSWHIFHFLKKSLIAPTFAFK